MLKKRKKKVRPVDLKCPVVLYMGVWFESFKTFGFAGLHDKMPVLQVRDHKITGVFFNPGIFCTTFRLKDLSPF